MGARPGRARLGHDEIYENHAVTAGRSPPAGGGGNDVIVEFHRIGNAIKVSAIDPATLTEVSIVGVPSLSEAELTRAVMRKLEYVLSRKK